ncbi:Gfo/Idh/MocA family protein [Georgenia subflava]|uniref:Gfo/Idh/MocA family oxidoreductase n=1 Tax=Georgenia subflava TaxID=1622177 RepID=A0A6N7EK11_9MICO|nr:Gfo/Idh/MocA family oxidoreductase [Georgenia subflava]MPV36895.1 gfo/Idh/MocA family oxidoreductase [Georgenia subflava]
MPTAAVIGCGDVATVHFEAIAAIDDIDLVAVCDTDPDVLAAAVEAYGVPGFADHRALLAEMRPDVVHVCTPHDQHVPVALDCLAAGVNVLTEKPLAHTLEDAERLVAAAEEGEARIGVCFQNRYNATSQAAREVLDSGELGKVVGATATVMWTRTPDYYRAKPWRGRWETAGGGLLINQAIHTLDLLQWLVGDVTGVAGHAATRVYGDVIEVEDSAEVVLSHADGARSVFFGTLGNVVNAPVTLDITAERGALSLRGDLTITYADGRVETVAERQAPSGGRSYWGVSHELLIRDFYARLGDAEPFWISPREAMKSLRILKDVYAQSFGPAAIG